MMCEAQVWKQGEHWRCGLLKGHALTHAWVLVDSDAPFPFMEDEDIEEDDEDPGQDETNT